MARYSIETKLPAAKVLERAERFFGEEGIGLKVTSRGEAALCIEGTEGYVTFSTCTSEVKGKRKTIDLEIETNGYDSLVRRFLTTL